MHLCGNHSFEMAFVDPSKDTMRRQEGEGGEHGTSLGLGINHCIYFFNK